MKGGTQAALALGVGYMLGRRRKMRTAMLMAAGAATGRMGGLGGSLFQRGVKMLGSSDMMDKVSPQVSEIADTVRGDLLDASKAAVAAAINNRIESLSDSLHERAETLRNPAAAAEDAGKGAEKAARGTARRGRRVIKGEEAEEPAGEEPEEPEDLEEPEDIEEPEDEEPEEPEEPEGEREEPRRRPARRGTQSTKSTQSTRTTRRRPAGTRSGR